MEPLGVLVRRYPEQSRALVEEDLLGQWAAAREAGDDAAAKDALDRAGAIGEAVADVSHDSVARDAAAVVLRATDRAVGSLVRGHRQYSAARKLYKSGQHAQAEPMLAAAESDLATAGSPLAFRAGAYVTTSTTYLGRPADALAHGRLLLQRLGPSAANYPTAEGMLRWTCGLAAMDLGSLDEALDQHRKALTAFQRTEETSNLAGVVQVISADYRALGDLDNQWLYQIESFRLAARYASFERSQVVVGGGASAAAIDGYLNVADELEHGVLARARIAKQPIFVCSALVRRAETLSALGARQEARAHIDEALRVWQDVPETAIKSRLRADLEMARAALSVDLGSKQRVAELNAAVEFVGKTNSRTRVARVLLLRARAYHDAGDELSAERDLNAGIAEVESERDKTSNDESRLTFFNTAVELYDDALHFYLRRGDDEKAFDILERRRSRWLLDRFQGRGTLEKASIEPWKILRTKIPAGVAVVSYAVSSDIDAWVATSGALRHVPLGKAGPVHHQMVAFHDALARGSLAEAKGAADALNETILEPLRPELAGMRMIVFLPDRFLNGLPFAALHDRRTGRYQIEDHLVSVAPSANFYVRALGRSVAEPGDGPALIVANPSLASGEESLQPLAGADAEAAGIASLLRSASILRGSDATVEHFVKAAADASLIHFAGHAVVNPLRPELSSLVLAPDREGGGTRLYARDIYRLRLPHVRLVVLSACDSANGKTVGDSPLSLATSFIAAGAPTVVASLWAVDDAATSEFFNDFYGRLRQGIQPAAALREAQISSLRSGVINPATWAAFEVIGGSAL